jgi:hypothetical protein
MTARKLDSYLSEPTSPLSRLTAAAQGLSTLARIWESVAPIGLARSCRVGHLDDGVLTLYADNGAIASKLNQQLPSLLEKLRKRGSKITGIRIDVQVKIPLPVSPYTPKPVISTTGLASLEELELNLPESKLKEALTNLIEHQRESKQDKTPDCHGSGDNQHEHDRKFE